MDLVFDLKWVKSVIVCTLYIFHLSDLYKETDVLNSKKRRPRLQCDQIIK